MSRIPIDSALTLVFMRSQRHDDSRNFIADSPDGQQMPLRGLDEQPAVRRRATFLTDHVTSHFKPIGEYRKPPNHRH
jgi:hypothetical protein